MVSIETLEEKSGNENLQKRISYYKSKMTRLNDLYIDGRISREKYEADYDEAQAKLKALNEDASVSINPDNIKKYKQLIESSTVIDIYNKLEPENKLAFWGEYIDHIEQDPDNPCDNWIVFFK